MLSNLGVLGRSVKPEKPLRLPSLSRPVDTAPSDERRVGRFQKDFRNAGESFI